jgi:hypothetical protein
MLVKESTSYLLLLCCSRRRRHHHHCHHVLKCWHVQSVAILKVRGVKLQYYEISPFNYTLLFPVVMYLMFTSKVAGDSFINP